MAKFRIVTNGVTYKIQEFRIPFPGFLRSPRWLDWEGEYGGITGTKEYCQEVIDRWNKEDADALKDWVEC